MSFALSLQTAPIAEPVTLVEAKAHLRIDSDDEDTHLGALIQAAREYCEGVQHRAYLSQTWDIKLDAFPSGDCIEIPMAPLQSVTSITYIDGDGVTQTWDSANYNVLTAGLPPRIELGYGKSWPSTRAQRQAVTVRAVLGHADAGDVPHTVKHAMLLLIGHWYENRESQTVGTVTSSPLKHAVDALLGQDRAGGWF